MTVGAIGVLMVAGSRLSADQRTERMKYSGTHVLVCDGGKALLLRNTRIEIDPKLDKVWETAIENPPTRRQGLDRPPRVFESVGARRSGIEQTDLHDRREEEFARDIARHIDRLRMDGVVRSLTVVASPRMLADLRRFFSEQTRSLVRKEIAKDIANKTVHDIEAYLSARR
jgi:protein required for attachment to host cells